MEQNQHNREQSAQEPFAFVPLPEKVNKNKPTRHDRYQQNCTTGRIHGTIKALTPIHVGSGTIDLGENVGQHSVELIKSVMRRKKEIIIPASSLKGVIRSVVEAISESCVCKISSEDKKLQERISEMGFRECRRTKQNDNLCVACRIFGAMGFQGNIAIQDAPRIEGKIVTKFVPELHSPQCYDVDEENRPMRKFYKHGKVATGETPIEACEVGSTFRFNVQIDNLSYAEWGLFFTALGLHPDYKFNLKIGGAKPRCLGSVEFKIDKVQLDDKQQDRYFQWGAQIDTEKTDHELKTWMNNCFEKAKDTLIQEKQLQILIDNMETPTTYDCPEDDY